MTRHRWGLVAAMALMVLSACGSKAGTDQTATSQDKRPLNNQAVTTTSSRGASAAPAAPAGPTATPTSSARKKTPECDAMYRMQTIRLALTRTETTPASKTTYLDDYKKTAETLKQSAPDISEQIDQRVGLTTKSVAAPLTPPEKQTSDELDKKLDAWWDTHCF